LLQSGLFSNGYYGFSAFVKSCLSFTSVSLIGAELHIMKLITRSDFIGPYYDAICMCFRLNLQ